MKTIILLGLYSLLLLTGCDSGQAVPVKPTPTAAAVKGQPLGERIVAEGRVTPVKSVDLILSVATTVSDVLVTEGDHVTSGQVLARLDARQQVAALAQAQAALDKAVGAKAVAEAALAKAQSALALLKAGPRPEDVAVAKAALSVAQAELARVQAGADTTTLAQAKANMDKAARAVQQAQYAFDRVKDAPGGAIGPDALRLEQATIDYDLAKTTYEQLVQGPRDVELGVARARAAQAQAALDQAQAGARAEQIAAAEADVAQAEAELKNLDADVASATAALAAAKGALADTELRAPFDGTLVMQNVKAGVPVPAGTLAARIADLSAWQIETTDLTELNIASVQEGLPATMTFDALPGLELSGHVSRIKPFGDSRQGDIVYTVVVAPDQRDARLRWNMTAKVAIGGK